ncbi:MAG: acyltransferase [Actinobacteria bacterium]|nr:acyltransferase [Actinomycetota bacterium]
MENTNLLLSINVFIDCFVSYAIPLFIFISGFVLAVNYYRDFSGWDFYKKRLSTIIPPYLIFSILYIIFTSIKIEPFGFELPTWKEALIRIITANGYFHLWFFALIIQFYLFYPLIIKAYRFLKFKNLNYLPLIVSFVIQVCWNLFAPSLISLIPENSIIFPVTSFIIGKFFFQFLFYFVMGIYISEKAIKGTFKISSKSLFFLLPVIILLTTFNTYKIVEAVKKYGNIEKLTVTIIDPRFSVLNGILGSLILIVLNGSIVLFLYYLSSVLSGRKIFLSRTLKEFGIYSFGIYLIHAAFLVITVNLLRMLFKVTPDTIAFYPIVFSTTAIISYLVVKAVSYVPYSQFFLGIHTKKTRF